MLRGKSGCYLVEQVMNDIIGDQLCAFGIGMHAVAGILSQSLIGDAAVVNINDGIAVGGGDGGDLCVEIADGVAVFIGGRIGFRIFIHISRVRFR